jgi:hypothetical protein
MALRRRITPIRRGRFFPLVPAAAPVVPARAPDWVHGRRPVPRRSAHGEFFPFVPASAPATPVRPPDWLRQRRPGPGRPSHGEFFPIAAAALQPVPPIISRRRAATGAGRRGELWPLPLVGVLPGVGPWLPPLLARRRIPAQSRRGEFLVVPLVGLAPSAPPPVVPPLLTHRPARVLLTRRGEFLPVVPAPAYCAAPVPRRKRPAAAIRRGRGWTAPPVSLPPPGPGPWLPRTLRAAPRSSPRRVARGRYWPMLLEAGCDCTTHRPNLGTTVRFSSGITARPGSGTTSRPCSCN